MARHYPDFLDAYLQYTDHTEAPFNFHVWTALSVIAGALQRRCYLKWGFRTLYPNLYIILVGPSGCGKGSAMKIGKSFLDSLPSVSIASESITREALIRSMKDCVSTFLDPVDQMPKFQCPITIMAEELAVFLGQGNIKFLADLTDWFDSHDSWEYRTKGSGVDKITGVCINLLSATAPDWLRSIFPQEAFGGGFTSRVVLVVEDGKRQLIADPTVPKETLKMGETLKRDLEQIALMSGEMLFTKQTMEYYSAWYYAQSKNPPIRDPHFAGYCERRVAHALKLSMVCSASRSNDKIITPEDLKRAITLLEAVEPKMPRAFNGLGKARYAEITAQIFDFLVKVGKVTRAGILDRFYQDLDEYTLGIVMKTLVARKVVTSIYDQNKCDYIYEIGKGE